MQYRKTEIVIWKINFREVCFSAVNGYSKQTRSKNVTTQNSTFERRLLCFDVWCSPIVYYMYSRTEYVQIWLHFAIRKRHLSFASKAFSLRLTSFIGFYSATHWEIVRTVIDDELHYLHYIFVSLIYRSRLLNNRIIKCNLSVIVTIF